MSISMVVWLLSVALAGVLLIAATRIERLGRIGNEAAAALLLVGFPFIPVIFLHVPLILLAASLQLWLMVLPARAIRGRLEPQFLGVSTRQNVLLGLVLAVLIAVLQWAQPLVFTSIGLTVLLIVSLGVALFFIGQVLWSMWHYQLSSKEAASASIPTVSVCIPARNETHALTECLQKVLASDYPKLEILVLDDCSHDNTSALIRSFAHDGVRFIQGNLPASGWLGKNQAMQTLFEHASGELLLFMDVDTHMEPHSVTQLVSHLTAGNLEMVSVWPQNRLGLQPATLFGTLEHYWRLVLPITRRQVPVSSKVWLVTAQSLKNLGGFASVSRKIVPEESFARRLAARKTYRFLLSSQSLGITTAKRWSSQVESSVRLAYPRLKRQPLAVYALVLAMLAVLCAPFVVTVVLMLLGDLSVAFWLALFTSLLFLATYYVVMARLQPHGWLLSGLLWPLVVVQEVVILIVSMLQYEFGEVNWKGRNVCYPVVSPRTEPLARPFLRR